MNPRANWRLVGGAACVGTVGQVAFLVEQHFGTNFVGIDFVPLRHAGMAVLAGHSVYSDPTFVYPPSAAPLLVPLALGTAGQASSVWALLGIALIAITGLLIGQAAPRHRVALSVIASYLLLISPGTRQSLDLGNLTMVLAPLCAGVVIAFHRRRWLLGCVLLAVSMLIKPLLLPLLVIPIIHRRWPELLRGFVPAAAVLLLAMLTIPGGMEVGRFVGYVMSGTNLHGANAVNGLSLTSWAEAHNSPMLLVAVADALLSAAAVSIAWLASRRRPSIFGAQLAILGFVTALLVGKIAEVNYLLPLLVLVLVRVAAEPSVRAAVSFGPFIALSSMQSDYLGLTHGTGANSWYVSLELIAFAGCLADLVWGWATASAPGRREPEAGVQQPEPHRAQLVPAR